MTNRTDQPRTDQPWYTRLQRLLTTPGGAQLEVTDLDGATIYLAPLSRHSRVDNTVLWLRQIIGPGPQFDLNACRRRSLPAPGHVDNELIRFTIDEGTATISPAGTEEQAAIAAWDNFIHTQCSEQTRSDLEALAEDSW